MADKKVSELTAITNLTRDDLFLVVNDPSGTPASRKITLANLFGNVIAETVHTSATTLRANTTISGTKLTVSANSTFNGSVTYNGDITFNRGATFSNTTVNVFGSNTIINGTLTANGNLSLGGSVSSGASNIIGSNGKINANNAITNGTITVPMLQETPVTNTAFQSALANTNVSIKDRMQVANVQSILANTNLAISDRIQVANVTSITSTLLDKSSEVQQNMFANLAIDVSTANGIVTTDSGVRISNGEIRIFSATGSPSLIDFYCEATNAHRVRVQAPAHAVFSGDTVLTLPNKSGNVATTNSELFTGTTITENLDVNDIFRITTKVSDFATSNAQTESVTAGSIYYSNTYLYVVTDSNTIKRVLLSTW